MRSEGTPAWAPGHEDDLHPVQVSILRRQTEGERLELAMALSRDLLAMSFENLRSLHPDLDERSLLRKFVGLLYGEDLARRVYGDP